MGGEPHGQGAEEVLPRSAPRHGVRGWLMERLARYLTEPAGHYELRGPNDFERLKGTIRKGDILLVEGDQRVSRVIKTLTQSCWSHAALYVGDELLRREETRDQAATVFGDAARHLVVEALFEGVVASPLDKYVDYNVRLCRPHRLRSQHLGQILDDAVSAIGWRYDLRNILDLAAHLLRVSLLPRREREDALRFGSGLASHVICTSLLGRMFHRVGFPVLPSIVHSEEPPAPGGARRGLWSVLRPRRTRYSGIYRRRHPTLLTPRDFDLSPYFEIVKWNVASVRGFDYSRIEWADEPAGEEPVAEADGEGERRVTG